MRIVAMGGENFMSLQEPFEVRMDAQGLVRVEGKNEMSQAADSNGAGKTALLVKFPSWVLFGVTPDGLRGDEIACRFNSKTCKGWMTLEDEQGQWTIRRTRRPATLMVEGTDWTGETMAALQERIESRLGWGPKTFNNMIVFGQGNFERFANAKQEDQMRMLDEIQGIDLSEALARAEAWRKDLKSKVDAATTGIRVGEESMARLDKMVNQLIQGQEHFDGNKEARIQDLRGQRAGLVAQRDQVHKGMEDLGPKIQRIEELKVVYDKLTDAKKILDGTAQDYRTAASAFEEAKNRIGELDNKLDKLVAAGKCPTCRSEFASRVEEVRSAFEPDFVGLRATLTSAVMAKADAEKAHQASTRHFEKWQKLWPFGAFSSSDYRALQKLEADEGQPAFDKLQAKYTQLSGQVDLLDKEIAREEAKEWEGAEALETNRRELGAVTQRLEASRLGLDRANKTLRVAEYWCVAFGDRGVRSLLVDSVAGYLNERLEAHLAILAKGEARVQVSAQTTLKSGKQKEDLTISPQWSYGAAGVGLGSGGQDRRVDLALFAAIQDLAESRSARPFPLKVYDEPFDALDGRGKEIMADWLKEQARTHGSVFVITHSEEMASLLEPDRVWTVRMDEEGTHVEAR